MTKIRLEEIYDSPEELGFMLDVLKLMGLEIKHDYAGNDRYAISVREKGGHWRNILSRDLEKVLSFLDVLEDIADLPRRERRAALRELRRAV